MYQSRIWGEEREEQMEFFIRVKSMLSNSLNRAEIKQGYTKTI